MGLTIISFTNKQTVQFKKNRTAGLMAKTNYWVKDPFQLMALYSLHVSVFLRVDRG